MFIIPSIFYLMGVTPAITGGQPFLGLADSGPEGEVCLRRVDAGTGLWGIQ